MFVFKAAVVGAGTMGGEIAQTIASAEIPVVLKDVDSKFVDQGLEKGRQVTEGQLGSLVKKEKITSEQADAQRHAILGRITGTTDYDAFGDVDFVIEAVPERMEIKQAVFAELDAVTPGHAILSSNTSSLSLSEMDDDTSRWPTWVDGLGHVLKADETWPQAGARVVWESRPGGRGRVLEQVTRYEARTGQVVEVEDERLLGTQTVRFAPVEGATRISLELDYRLKPGVFLRALVDLFFVRRAMADSMRRTLARFGRELAAEQELLR